MPTAESIIQVELKHALEELVQAQDRLAEMLLEQVNYPVEIQGCPDDEPMRPSVANFVRLLEYANDQMEPGDTINQVGIVGTNQLTLDQITHVNTARKIVQDTLKKMDKFREPEGDKVVSVAKRALATLGYPRFNRRQARRQFVTFPHGLDSVSFTWAKSKVVSEVTIKQARNLLDKKYKDDNSAAGQDAWYALSTLLDVLPPDEPLVRVAPPVIHPRANVNYTINGKKDRDFKVAISPIFMLSRENGALPRIKPLGDKDAPSTRLKRSDAQVEEEPYIRSIRIHRYLPEFVEEKIKKRKNRKH